MKRTIFLYIFCCLFLFSCSDSSQQRKLELENDKGELVLYLPFNGNFLDEGVFNFSTEVKGDEVSFADGVQGEAVFIGGSEDWVEVKIDESISFENGATLELWFKRDDWTNPYRAGSGGQILGTIDGIILKLDNRGGAKKRIWKLAGSVGVSDSRVRVLSQKSEIASDVWMHAAIVYASSISKVQLYLDGSLVDEQEDAHPQFRQKFVNPFKVGTWYKKNEAFRGFVDDVKLYNYAKSPEEIATDALL